MALAGLSVHLVETDAAGQARAEANIGKLITQRVERGSISDAATFRARLTFGAGYDNLPPVDLAIEAAFESLEVKRVIFAALQAALSASTILATNTSYLDVNLLAEGIVEPGRFLGLHFFAPAHAMKLLEIVRGTKTSNATLGQAFALAKRLGKMPVISGVCDGFIGNRILSRYRQVVDVLMLEGSCPKGIDDAMRGFGMAMGPYEAQDLSGLDIAYANRKRQNLKDRTDIRYVTIADHLVEDLKRFPLAHRVDAGLQRQRITHAFQRHVTADVAFGGGTDHVAHVLLARVDGDNVRQDVLGDTQTGCIGVRDEKLHRPGSPRRKQRQQPDRACPR